MTDHKGPIKTTLNRIFYRTVSVGTASVPNESASVHLDAIRGVASFAILFNHWRLLCFCNYHDVKQRSLFLALFYFLTSFSSQAVMIFFVLSGYLVGGSVLRQMQEGRWRWSIYLANRLTRLLVVLVPALVLTWASDRLVMRLFPHGLVTQLLIHTHEANPALPISSGLKTLLGNLFFVQGILVLPYGTNSPLWSLANEFWYYLAFPSIIAIFNQTDWKNKLRNACLSLLILVFVGDSIRLYFSIWLLGALLNRFPQLPAVPNAWGRRAIIAAAFLVVAAILVRGKLLTVFVFEWELLLALAFCLFLLVTISLSAEKPARLYASVSKNLASSAYTLYLVHFPVLAGLATISRLTPIDPSTAHLREYLTALALLLETYGIALVLWWCFERNTSKLRMLFLRSAKKT